MFLVKYQIVPNKVIKEFGGIPFGDGTYLGVVDTLDTNHTQITPNTVPADLLIQLRKSYYFYSGKDLAFNPDGTVNVVSPTIDLLKILKLDELANKTASYIERYYPDIKQRSDVADKEYCGSQLLVMNAAYTTDQIYKDCANYASQILSGTSNLQTIVSGLPANEQPYWEQLIKVAVRVGWVNMCKQVYRQLKAQIQTATTKTQLPVINTGLFPKYPKGV